MFRLSCARLYLGLVHEFKIRLLPVMRFCSDRRNIKAMGGLHVRRVVEAADEGVGCDFNSALYVAIASQGKVREPARSGSHAKLHRQASRRHRQIESVLERYT